MRAGNVLFLPHLRLLIKERGLELTWHMFIKYFVHFGMGQRAAMLGILRVFQHIKLFLL